MPRFSTFFAVAASDATVWLVVFFAFLSVALLAMLVSSRRRTRELLAEERREKALDEVVNRFVSGMEARFRAEAIYWKDRDRASSLSGLMHYAEIAETLSSGYDCVYYIDLATNHFEQYQAHGMYVSLQIETEGKDFFAVTQENLPRDMHPLDLPRMQAAFTKENMVAATEGGKTFSITYRLYVGGRHYWYNVRAMRTGPDEPGHLVVAVSNVDEQVRREKMFEEKANASVAKLEELLARSAKSRSTLAKLATYQDAGEIRDLSLRETGLSLDAVAVLLWRHEPDGTTPLDGSWFRSAESGAPAHLTVQDFEVPDYLDAHPEILYVRGQETENSPRWDSMLERAGAHRFLAAPIKVDGETWGHVSFLSDKEGPPDKTDIERFREACSLVQIGVLRAKFIAAREAHQRQLLAAARAANRAAQAKTTFLATMSHEIRTPLNAVIGFGELLENKNLSPEQVREYATGISFSANALLALINDILDLSKLESGKMDMSGTCDLAALFHELEAVFAVSAAKKGVKLEHEIARDFPVLGLSEERIRQVMLNLVSNSVKFTESGAVQWSAACRPDGEGTVAVEISVSDSGIGISKEKLRSIFDPFVQDGATRGGKVYTGTGLGLPIVKRLVESAGGSVAVESTPGVGTKTVVYIPHVKTLARLRSADPAQAADASSAAKSADSASNAAAVKKFSALLVDDVPLNLKILSLHLRGLGVTDIATAESGTKALELLPKVKPDVILTDMWMPGMSGADLAATIRKDKKFRNTPIVAVTADNDMGSTFDTTLFSGILTKPVAAAKLRESLRPFFPASATLG